MSILRLLIIPAVAGILLLLLNAGGYIVVPEGVAGPQVNTASEGWSAVATNISESDSGALRIELAIRNNTADWSAMKTAPDKPAVLTSGGKTTNCETVFIGTGGHRLAPGFQMRGFTAGKKSAPVTQLIYVECEGAKAEAGATLSVDYTYYTGQYNYYEKEANKVDANLVVNLDQVTADLKYPLGQEVAGLIQPATTEITALNDVVLTLTGTTRTDTGLEFTWQTNNPGEYPSSIHIGNPPVIGSDGILYGFYQSPDIASVPMTPAGKTAEWTTEVAVPQEVTGLYIMLSVESGKQRQFANYAVDITDK